MKRQWTKRQCKRWRPQGRLEFPKTQGRSCVASKIIKFNVMLDNTRRLWKKATFFLCRCQQFQHPCCSPFQILQFIFSFAGSAVFPNHPLNFFLMASMTSTKLSVYSVFWATKASPITCAGAILAAMKTSNMPFTSMTRSFLAATNMPSATLSIRLLPSQLLMIKLFQTSIESLLKISTRNWAN